VAKSTLTTVQRKLAADVNEIVARTLFDKDVSGLSDRLFTVRNWNLYSREFPILDVGFRTAGRIELRLRLVTKNWNDEPPSVDILNSEGEFLTRAPQYPGGPFNNNAHPSTGRPFVCMAGIKEYHTHPSHSNDAWANYKGKADYTLGGILTQLWNAWLKTTP
jgi:hypothetical protein